MQSARARRVAGAVAVLAVAIAAPASADDAAGAPRLTTDVWREPAPPLEPLWRLLRLPEQAVELVFTPFAVVVTLVERYRLDRRVDDALKNDDGTIRFIPGVKIGFGDGFGLGGKLKVRSFSERSFDVGGGYKLNGDFDLGLDYDQRVASAEGRHLRVELSYELDGNLPYYGIGGDTRVDDERILSSRYADARVSFDLTPLGALTWTGDAHVGWRHERLAPGAGGSAPAVGADPMDPVAPPPGFGETLDFPYLHARVRYDTRDNVGIPTVGWVSELEAGITHALGGDRDLGAVSGRASALRFVSVLPMKRVLVLGGGVGGALPTGADGAIPLHELMVLGRKESLRGYSKTRFRDQLGWWATVEYRWLIWEYEDTRAGLLPTLFFDIGRVAGRADELLSGPLRYSAGIGLRGAHDTLMAFHLNLGWSPEGLQFGFAAGADL
jgi:opacity protein-like surface antigen